VSSSSSSPTAKPSVALESNLIKAHQPPLQRAAQDDKKYPYSLHHLEAEPYRRIFITRRVGGCAAPWTLLTALRGLWACGRRTLFLVKRVFPLPKRPRAPSTASARCPEFRHPALFPASAREDQLRGLPSAPAARCDGVPGPQRRTFSQLLPAPDGKVAERLDFEAAARIAQDGGLEQDSPPTRRLTLAGWLGVAATVLALAAESTRGGRAVVPDCGRGKLGPAGTPPTPAIASPGEILQRVLGRALQPVEPV